MAVTFQKRQKEMKRLEKQRAKAERRAQRKLEKGSKDEPLNELPESGVNEPQADSSPQDPQQS